MGLWSVEGQAAREWMPGSCTGAVPADGDSRAAREANRAVLKQRRSKKLSTHPFFWGAFVATGDWR
jgi:CHAT domain-containing protein